MTFTTPLTDITIPEGDTATFTCVTSKPEKVQWFKNGKKITKPSKRIQLRDDGPEHTLVIDKSELDDGAEYTAKIGDESTTGKLIVEGNFSCYLAWHFAAPEISLIKISFLLFYIFASAFIILYNLNCRRYLADMISTLNVNASWRKSHACSNALSSECQKSNGWSRYFDLHCIVFNSSLARLCFLSIMIFTPVYI